MFQSLMDSWRRYRARKQLERLGMIPAPEKTENGIGTARSRVIAGLIIVFLWSMTSLLLTLAQQVPRDNSELVLKQNYAPKTINAGFPFSYEDRLATEHARAEAIRNAPHFYTVSEKDAAALNNRITRFFNAVRSYPGDSGTLETDLAASLPENIRAVLKDCMLNASARRYWDDTLEKLRDTGIFSRKTKDALPENALVQIADRQRRFRLRRASAIPDPQKAADMLAEALLRFQSGSGTVRSRAISAVFVRLIGQEGTLREEEQLTQEAVKNALSKVESVVTRYALNDTLVRKNDFIDRQKHDLLKCYFEAKRSHENPVEQWGLLSRNMFWSLIMVLTGGFYLYHLHRNVLRENRNLAVLAAVMILSMAAEYGGIRLFQQLVQDSDSLPSALLIDAVPVGLAAVVLAPVMGFRVGLCAGFFSASAAALMLDMPFEYALKGIVISLLSALAVRQATNYKAYFCWIFFAVFPLVWLLNSDLLFRIKDPDMAFVLSFCTALGNGAGTAFLAMLILFIFEAIFHNSTNMTLMELCSGNHALLERMKREAPGTFFHSQTVAALAEDGALFHDIGKLELPQYFTENNQNSVNQHTDLRPDTSSIIIRDHVKKGLALAREYKLGPVVSAAIAQHHGTDLVHFFYRAEVENAKLTGEKVDEEKFRYPGPRPQTRETAIISLADACEAASRSMEKPTPEALEMLVNRIFEQRFKDGQLREANITLAELEKVRKSLINTLLSMKHGRIAYRDEEEDEHGDPLPLDPVRRTAAEESGRPARAEKNDPAGR